MSVRKRRSGSCEYSRRKLLGLYFSELSKIPLLSADEERQLGMRAANGDEEAVRRLVEANLRFVVKVAKRYRGRGMSYSDLIHEGNLGLIEAAKRFDVNRQVKFISYAVWWIRQSILIALCNMGHATKLPPRVTHLLHKINQSKRKLLSNRESVNADELAADAGITTTQLEKVMNMQGRVLSLYQPVGNDSDLMLADILVSQAGPSIEDRLAVESAKTALLCALSTLENREQTILRMRYGFEKGSPQTLSEIGKRMGLSRERVRQIEFNALQKLRRHRKTRNLRGIAV